jgi:DNA-PKcs, CC5
LLIELVRNKAVSDEEVTVFLEPLLQIVDKHTKPGSRSLFYQLMHEIIEHHPQLRDRVHPKALQGLVDEDPGIAEACYNFWDQETHLPLNSLVRLREIFTRLYDPEVEEHWLQVERGCTSVMLLFLFVCVCVWHRVSFFFFCFVVLSFFLILFFWIVFFLLSSSCCRSSLVYCTAGLSAHSSIYTVSHTLTLSHSIGVP